jgi:excisionase family DNA binding protein
MMNRNEAAEYLGISTRTLQRQVKDGKISVRYEPGSNGEIAIFDKDELDRYREDKQTVRIQPTASDSSSDPNTADIIPNNPSSGGFLAPITVLVERLISALTDRESSNSKTTPAMLRGKLLLNLEEAQIITGLSREILMTAIRTGQLPSQIMGKAYRIKHKDLERYIDELWN